MAFRSLAVLSLLMIGSSAASTATPPADALAAVNAALAKHLLVLERGTPILK